MRYAGSREALVDALDAYTRCRRSGHRAGADGRPSMPIERPRRSLDGPGAEHSTRQPRERPNRFNARSRWSANCSTWFNGLRERCDQCQDQSAWHVNDAILSRRVSHPAQLQRSAGRNAGDEDRLQSWVVAGSRGAPVALSTAFAWEALPAPIDPEGARAALSSRRAQ